MKKHEQYSVGLYCRLSKDDLGSGDSSSIISQKTMLNKYVCDNGWNMGYELGDVGGTYLTDRTSWVPPMIERTKTTVVPTKLVKEEYDNSSAFWGQYNLNIGYGASGEDFAAGVLTGILAQKWQNSQLEKQIANNPDFIKLYEYSMDGMGYSDSASWTSEYTSNILECTLNQVGTFYLGQYF